MGRGGRARIRFVDVLSQPLTGGDHCLIPALFTEPVQQIGEQRFREGQLGHCWTGAPPGLVISPLRRSNSFALIHPRAGRQGLFSHAPPNSNAHVPTASAIGMVASMKCPIWPRRSAGR